MPDLGAQGDARQSPRFLVTQHPTLESNRAFMGSDRHQLVAPLLKVRSQLPELSWKILMNQQQPHAKTR